VAAATVALLAGVMAGARFLVHSGDDLLADDGSGKVEVRQVVVGNGLADLDIVDGEPRQTKASTPQLDITVRNTGEDPVLLTKVRVAIVDSARLSICQYHIGDAIPATWKYAMELPALPFAAERIVSRPLHQEVGPGELDRFKVLFRVPWSGQENYVYALRATLVSEGGEPIDVGRFVLAIPDTVDRRELYLPYGRIPFNATERLMSTWCARRNLADLRRVLHRPGSRSSSMASLEGLRPADWWRDFADPRPPRKAAELLLRRWSTEGPVLAVFAAERTGDRQLVEEVRSTAAVALLRQAERALDLEYPWSAWAAVIAARYAQRFLPSREAHELLLLAESRWEATRAELPSEEAR